MNRTINSSQIQRLLTAIAFAFSFTLVALASTESTIHSFSPEPNGANPQVGLISDAAGNLYGATTKGGAYGVVFRLSRNSHGQWVETVLHNFTGGRGGPDGAFPMAEVMLDSTGNLYGTTQGGGSHGCGTAFKLSPATSGPWKETIIHNFACYPVDGSWPSGALISDASGNLYGVTAEGGSVGCSDNQGDPAYGCGTVYELSPAAGGTYTETILLNVGSLSSENFPSGPLTFDSAGNLYGTNESGGTGTGCSYYGCGTVFKLTKSSSGWTESIIYNLNGAADGDSPVSGVFFDSTGNLYGTGQGYFSTGGVFILSPNSSGGWTETSPFQFTGISNGLYENHGNVVRDSAGNLYGAAEVGGLPDCASGTTCGGIYELSDTASGWTETNLYEFTNGSDGAFPMSTLLRDGAGNLYTTTYYGGQGGGSVFKLSPSGKGKWTVTALYDFPVLAEGATPWAGLIPDGEGNYYGTTATGGSSASCLYWTGCGTVYKLSPNGTGGWTETAIYVFTGKNGDGIYPTGALARDAQGNLYGTTRTGGLSASCPNYDDYCGTVFKLSPNTNGTWTETVIHSFASGADGANPYWGVTLDSAGNLYGATQYGGGNDEGVVYELSPNSDGTYTETILHSFTGITEGGSSSPLIFDAQGNLYGTGWVSGQNSGVVFKLSPSIGGWTESIVYVFGTSGSWPNGNLQFDGAGNLYGAASIGGTYTAGLIYKLTPTTSGYWTQTVLYNFVGANGDGDSPWGGVTFDAAGNIYGTTNYGGIYSATCGSIGCGTVYELTPTSSGPWHERVLHRFSGGTDGSIPYDPVIVDSSGDVFGTVSAGGPGASGTIFEIKP